MKYKESMSGTQSKEKSALSSKLKSTKLKVEATKPNSKVASLSKPAFKPIGRQLTLTESLPIGSKVRSKVKERLTPRVKHGGIESKGKRKTTRPFFAKAPMHIVLYSERAKGSWSMLHRKHKSAVTSMIYVYAERFKVRVYRAANVGNHIHLLVKADEKKQLSDFLRVLAGRVAITVSGARKGIKRIGKFWDSLCWSRLVNWGKDFYHVQSYVLANELETISKKHREMILTASKYMVEKYGPEEWLGATIRARE